MIQSFQASEIVVLSLLVPMIAAAIVLLWGRRIVRQGDWLIGLALSFSFIGFVLASIEMYRQGFKPELWQKGWIWSRSEVGSITVGVLTDFSGLAFALISILAGLVLLAQRIVLQRELRVDRIYSGIGFAFTGLALSWFSLTPWLAVVGLLLTVFGGFVALGARWNSSTDAGTATRFGWERMSGVLLCTLGACGLAVSRVSLNWMTPEADSIISTASTEVSLNDFIGASLLVTGLYIQCQPFPLLGWLARSTESLISVRMILAQGVPAAAAFAILFRLESQLRSLGIFPGVGWVYLTSALLALGMGLSQPGSQTSFGAWLSSGMSLCVAALAFAGQASGLALLIGVFLGTVVVASSATAIDLGVPPSSSAILRGRWMKVIGFLGMGSATGMIGFISTSGMIQWIALSWKLPLQLSVTLFVLFLFTLLGWKLIWRYLQGDRPVDVGWTSILSLVLLLIVSLAVFWVGSATGGVIPGGLDQVLISLFKQFFAEFQTTLPDHGVMTVISSVYFGIFVASFAVSFWLARKEYWQPKTQTLSELRKIVATGYGVDDLSHFILNGLTLLGRGVENLVDQKIWSEWIPRAISQFIRRISIFISDTDGAVYHRFSVVLKNGVEAPAKALQFLQNGDVQWYLLFAVGSGIAILIHFLKF